MWLISFDIKQYSERLFRHKFDYRYLQSQRTSTKVKNIRFTDFAFGGTGSGRNYYADTKIGQVYLGSTTVGAIDAIEGFGGEIGDGCVTISLSLPMKTSFKNSS